MTSPHPSSNHKHLLTRMLDHRTSHSAKTTCWGIKRRRSSGTSYEHGHLLSTRVTSSFPVTAPKTGDWNLHPGNNLAPEWLIAIQHHHWHGNIITNHLPSQPRLVSIRSLSWGSLAGMMSCRYQGTLHEMSQPPAEIEGQIMTKSSGSNPIFGGETHRHRVHSSLCYLEKKNLFELKLYPRNLANNTNPFNKGVILYLWSTTSSRFSNDSTLSGAHPSMERARTRERVLIEAGMPPEKAFRKAAKRTPLGYPPLPRLKLEGRLPSPGPESEHKDPAHNVDPRVKPGVVFKKIDYCQSPECIPGLQMPVHAQGLELGLPGMNKKTEQHMPPRYGASPSRNLPKIYLGDNAPTPRWLIRPVKTDEDPPSPRTSQLPPLGRLRWEFEPGLPGQHGQDESRLREYAYQYLQNALCDPIVREELRQMIWDSRYNETIAHVDDPLPVPPPPPHFKDQRPSDYVNLRPPISPSNPDDYHFVYPGYERPSLAARAYDSLTSPESSYAGSYASRSSMGESDGTRTRASTSSSVSTNAKDLLPEYYHHELSEDHHHHIRPNSQSDADTGTDTEAQTKTSSVASPRALASPISTSKNAHPTSGSLLRNPPNRGRGQSKRVYVESPGLDELSSADTETEAELPPRKKKGGKNVPVSSKSTWSPNSTSNSDAFSGIERDKPVSKLPRGKATRKKATGKAAGKGKAVKAKRKGKAAKRS